MPQTAAGSSQPIGTPRARSRDTVQLPPRSTLGLRDKGRRTANTIPVSRIGNKRELRLCPKVWTSPGLHMDLDRSTEVYMGSKTVVAVIGLDRVKPTRRC